MKVATTDYVQNVANSGGGNSNVVVEEKRCSHFSGWDPKVIFESAVPIKAVISVEFTRPVGSLDDPMNAPRKWVVADYELTADRTQVKVLKALETGGTMAPQYDPEYGTDVARITYVI